MCRVCAAIIFSAFTAFAQGELGRNYGRSMVISQQGIAATSQPLASQAAAQILARGGSAIDAAIAANAVLALVEPMMASIGGDLFVLYQDAKTGELTGLNASGPAPRGLTPELLTSRGLTKMPTLGIHTVTVPGAVEGWARMHKKLGKLPWRDLFQAAIGYAEQGFPVTEGICEQWTRATANLDGYPESQRVFLPQHRAPRQGELFRNPDLGHAYRLIAEQGPDAFYKGEIAAAILKTSQHLGGTLSAEDLASFHSEWVTPISSDYRGWRVYELPPNGQGMAALEMLNIMETLPAAPAPFSPAEMHLRIEAMKLAYSDLRRYDADPRFAKVPVAGILSKDYARKRAASIDPHKANCGVTAGQPVASDTTYLTVVDREGNIASWIESVSGLFGSGITVEGMGFLLHNRGGGFTLEAGHPNRLAPGKRPFHTIIPAFLVKGDVQIGFGIMGGPNQPLAHAQFVSNIVDYGMNIQQALESPRFFKGSANLCTVSIEGRVPSATVKQLEAWGHEVAVRKEYTQEMGRGQAILHDSKTGTNYAASDPRADGQATPEPMELQK
jgi:gamma-glutamyltranspeptidase/glutathione hydrolase